MSSVPERGYPLSALFVLMAACAIPMSMAAAAGRAITEGRVGGAQVTFAALGGCASVMLLGAVVGLYHYRQALGVIVGGAAGAAVGSMVGPMVLVPKYDFPYLLLVAVGGSAAMVGLAAWFRTQAERRREPTAPKWFLEEPPFGYASRGASQAGVVEAEAAAAQDGQFADSPFPPTAPAPTRSNLRGAGFGCLYAIASWIVVGLIAAPLVAVIFSDSRWDAGAIAAAVSAATLVLIACPLGVIGFLIHRRRKAGLQ